MAGSAARLLLQLGWRRGVEGGRWWGQRGRVGREGARQRGVWETPVLAAPAWGVLAAAGGLLCFQILSVRGLNAMCR